MIRNKGNVIQALALRCFGPKAYIIRKVAEGINIKMLDADQAAHACGLQPEPSNLIMASSMSDIRNAARSVQAAGQFDPKHRREQG